MKFYIKTYGCQMNLRDSDSAAALLIEHGMTPADGEADADLVILNTCRDRVFWHSRHGQSKSIPARDRLW